MQRQQVGGMGHHHHHHHRDEAALTAAAHEFSAVNTILVVGILSLCLLARYLLRKYDVRWVPASVFLPCPALSCWCGKCTCLSKRQLASIFRGEHSNTFVGIEVY